MKTVKNFLSFVEIQTKIASVIPFLLGLSYARYRFAAVNIHVSTVFFIAMILFDMTTTAINNYIDTKAAKTKAHFSSQASVIIIFLMGGLSAAIGLYLAYLSGIVVLICGMICFFIGIFYTFGPIPISRTPYGEIFSGIVMGFFITFICIYINFPDIIKVDFNAPYITANFNMPELVRIIILTVPVALSISNIMLCNNICDLESDAAIRRYTLPFYIGVENALKLFSLLYYTAYGFIILMCVAGIIPFFCIACVLSAIPVRKNIKRFIFKQSKSETFPLCILNFILLTIPFILVIALGGFSV